VTLKINWFLEAKHISALDYIDNIQLTSNIMGFEYDLNTVTKKEGNFLMPEYFKLESEGRKLQLINNAGSTQTIDISSLPKGLYLVKVSNVANNLVEVQKVMKE
jgi:hypothetical protein